MMLIDGLNEYYEKVKSMEERIAKLEVVLRAAIEFELLVAGFANGTVRDRLRTALDAAKASD